jgi:hypothetical protein
MRTCVRLVAVGTLSLSSWLGLKLSALAQQPPIPPAAIDQLQQVIGNRVELGTILGGDYAAAGGIYSFRGGNVADLSLTRLGGGGDVASPGPLGLGGIKWAPVLQGNLGQFQADNEFKNGYLQGNRTSYDTHAVQAGGGARFYFTERLSFAPTISGIYGHTENNFDPRNPAGELVKMVATGTLVDWKVDTWSVVPALDLRYDWTWGRTTFEFRSRFNFFHTESFQSTSPVVGVNGDSQTWENKLDADVPLGWKLLGGELHTGGFFSRTELFGGAAEGLNASSFYTFNGRFVFDPNGKLWKLRWFGLGASYFWGNQFQGWSAGLDLALRF